MNSFTRLVVAPAAGVLAAAFVGFGAAVASADPSPAPPVPGAPNSPSHGSLVDQPGDDGNSGWGYLPGGAGAQCENAWVVCGSDNNPPASNITPGHDDDNGWVSAPGQTGADCENPGVTCTDVG